MTEHEPLAIEVRDLRMRYRKTRTMRDVLLRPGRPEWVEVLKGLDLEVRSGEVVGIIGANGSGKTSLVKVLATLVLPTSGTARVWGPEWPGP